MKTKSNIKIPKGATHVAITDNKGRQSNLDLATFALQNIADLQDMGVLMQFVKVTGKGKASKATMLGEAIPTAAKVADVPAMVIEQVATEKAPAVIVERAQPIAGLDGINDVLVCTPDSGAWNLKHAEVHEVITNRDPASYPFARYELIATRFPDSKWGSIRCSDNQQEVGAAVNMEKGSYYLFDHAKRMNFIDALMSGVEKIGGKLRHITALTLKDRAREVDTFALEGKDKFTAGGREIRNNLALVTDVEKIIGMVLANTSTTICCKNTCQMVVDDTNAPLYGKIKFTKFADVQIAEIPKIVQAFLTGNDLLMRRLNEWHNIGITEIQAEQIFAAWLGDLANPMSSRTGNIVARLKELHIKGIGNKGETALDCFNAVTQFYTHESAGETKDPTKQLESSENIDGDAAKAKSQFFGFLTKSLANNQGMAGTFKIGETILVAYNDNQKKKATDKATK